MNAAGENIAARQIQILNGRGDSIPFRKKSVGRRGNPKSAILAGDKMFDRKWGRDLREHDCLFDAKKMGLDDFHDVIVNFLFQIFVLLWASSPFTVNPRFKIFNRNNRNDL